MPSGSDEVDAGGARRRRAVLEFGEFLAAIGSSLDARTRLLRPCPRLVAEPVRLAANLIRDGFLLPGLGFEEQIAFIREGVVAALGAEDAARIDAADLDHVVRDGPQEGSIMRGHEVAEGRGAQEFFEPDHAGKVEVIGRFVHEQDVGFAREFAGQGESLPPAAGKRTCLLVEIREADLSESDGGLRLAFVLFERIVLEPGECGREHGLAHFEGVVLREEPDLQPAASDDLAFIRCFAADQNLEQRGFAGTVRADETDAFPGAEFDP